MEKLERGWSRGLIAVLCMLGIDLESPEEGIHGDQSPAHKGGFGKRKSLPLSGTDFVIVEDEEADIEQDREGECRTEEPYCEPRGSRPRREWPRSDIVADEPECPRRSGGARSCEVLGRVLVVRWPGMERDWERERGGSSVLLLRSTRRRRSADCCCCCGHGEGSGQGHGPPGVRLSPLPLVSVLDSVGRVGGDREEGEKRV